MDWRTALRGTVTGIFSVPVGTCLGAFTGAVVLVAYTALSSASSPGLGGLAFVLMTAAYAGSVGFGYALVFGFPVLLLLRLADACTPWACSACGAGIALLAFGPAAGSETLSAIIGAAGGLAAWLGSYGVGPDDDRAALWA